MQLAVTRIDKDLPLPRYETAGACAFDVLARIETVIPPKTLGFVPGNVIVCVPEGHVLMLASRSSTPRKKGLLTPHGFGTIDQDYCGPDDELIVQVYNFTDEPVTVARGERIAQALIVPVAKFEIIETPPNASRSRGGFGTTG
ncbi:MAG: dUTP diphosphatase [Patescibacteria group bacterium]|nr:dUTP diphosphatase [Patescibacteria group bacterium]